MNVQHRLRSVLQRIKNGVISKIRGRGGVGSPRAVSFASSPLIAIDIDVGSPTQAGPRSPSLLDNDFLQVPSSYSSNASLSQTQSDCSAVSVVVAQNARLPDVPFLPTSAISSSSCVLPVTSDVLSGLVPCASQTQDSSQPPTQGMSQVCFESATTVSCTDRKPLPRPAEFRPAAATPAATLYNPSSGTGATAPAAAEAAAASDFDWTGSVCFDPLSPGTYARHRTLLDLTLIGAFAGLLQRNLSKLAPIILIDGHITGTAYLYWAQAVGADGCRSSASARSRHDRDLDVFAAYWMALTWHEETELGHRDLLEFVANLSRDLRKPPKRPKRGTAAKVHLQRMQAAAKAYRQAADQFRVVRDQFLRRVNYRLAVNIDLVRRARDLLVAAGAPGTLLRYRVKDASDTALEWYFPQAPLVAPEYR